MYRPYRLEDDEAIKAIHAVAFAGKSDDIGRWYDIAGRENIRVWDPDVVTATLIDIPMGLFMGGRSVPLHGVAGVGVAAHARGRGIARAMMTAHLRELHQNQVPLAALFASTRTLYNRVGYGIAGTAHQASLPTSLFRQHGDTSGSWRPITTADHTVIENTYRSQFSGQPAAIDRGPYLWQRIWKREGHENPAWVLEDDGMAAWVVTRQVRGDPWFDLHIEDYGARDRDALLKLMGFLGGFAAMARTTHFKPGPREVLFDVLPEHRVSMSLFEPWLLRIVDVKSALEQRGWSPYTTAQVSLQVRDPTLPENSGNYILTVEGGKATVDRGGSGNSTIDVTALSGLYTGYASPSHLAKMGQLTASAEDQERLGALFAGFPPMLRDFF